MLCALIFRLRPTLKNLFPFTFEYDNEVNNFSAWNLTSIHLIIAYCTKFTCPENICCSLLKKWWTLDISSRFFLQ